MSRNVLKLIPRDPAFVPDEASIETARVSLALRHPRPLKIVATVTEHVEFIDPGTNLQSIRCPRCETRLENAWWASSVDEAYRFHFADLTVALPCCGARTSLNDLVYDWPAGFARFSLQIADPSVTKLDEDEVQTLEAILGTQLRVVWAHY